MEQYDSNSSSSSSSAITFQPSKDFPAKMAASSPPEIDGLLADAGYLVKSSDLVHVAHRLEQLENVMVAAQPPVISHLAYDAVHYNPSDLAGWVESMIGELGPSALPEFLVEDFPTIDFPGNYQMPVAGFQMQTTAAAGEEESLVPAHDNGGVRPDFTGTTVEEDSGIRLVHLLMSCAEAVQRGDTQLAAILIQEMRILLSRSSTGGIGKVAGCFIDALSRRLGYGPTQAVCAESALENEILYHNFYEACPYLKFAHFTANQAILEAFNGHDQVHVVDFSLMHGLQWPALIQALALRVGGPPLLRLTGIGPPSPDGRDALREIGLKLAELAKSVNVRFSFRGVAAERLDDVKPWMLQVDPKEALAVNSIMQMHRLLYSDPGRGSPIDSVLKWLKGLKPKIMTVVEHEANHNQASFMDRFTEALYYYSTMFDSLDSCTLMPEKSVAEIYLQREICNVVCCEGPARVERHETLAQWRTRLEGAGFKPLHLGSNAFKQASMLLTLFSANGYCVEENNGCLTLGWHSRPLIAASAWQAADSDCPDGHAVENML
ncbi:protein SLENDER RICE1-LIKE 1-like [Nymphaea colorata]|uniref:DELLA protein n=1 Tax=Nymphaea colorata TaxID=210225 RepID=A0A5K0VWP7_9MAGN|nr:protein SLENDER RICE1-LIKE 1-like [Nymphaea colorata]